MGASTLRADPVERARLLAQIREAVLSGAPAPQQPRLLVSESWRRSLAARVNPESSGGPPEVFDRREVASIRAAHPLAETLPLLRETLVGIADEAMHMMIVTDAHGHILWCEGQSGVLRLAEGVGLAEGTRWSEDAIGTNAMGTALAENRTVQIHSAEHLVRTYHSWTCAASPVHDPDTGEIVGVVDVTGPVGGFHPSTSALVAAAAKLAESQLRFRMQASDEQLRARNMAQLTALRGEQGALVTPSGRVLTSAPANWLPLPRVALPDDVGGGGPLVLPDGRDAVLEPLERLTDGFLLRIRTQSKARGEVATVPRPTLQLRFLGTTRPLATLNGQPLRLTQRHADMLTLLVLHPAGISAEQLATALYGDRGNPVTARSEIHRLRGLLGAAVVRSGPYRLHADVTADFRTAHTELRAGRVREAAAGYRGELLPASEAPAVIEERELLFATLRRAALDHADVEAMWSLADTEAAADDVELVEALATALPRTDPRHAAMTARAERLTHG